MHRFRSSAIAAVLLLPSAAIAQTAGSNQPSDASSPLLGRWQLDLTRMPATYGPPPKRVRYTFSEDDAGRWTTTVEITAPDDSVRRSIARHRRDGQAVRGEGDTTEADSAALLSPAPNVLVMNLGKDRLPGSVRVYVVAPNGHEMTESAAAVDASGAPFVRVFHFRRID